MPRNRKDPETKQFGKYMSPTLIMRRMEVNDMEIVIPRDATIKRMKLYITEHNLWRRKNKLPKAEFKIRECDIYIKRKSGTIYHAIGFEIARVK